MAARPSCTFQKLPGMMQRSRPPHSPRAAVEKAVAMLLPVPEVFPNPPGRPVRAFPQTSARCSRYRLQRLGESRWLHRVQQRRVPGGNCPGGIGNGFLEVGGTSASTPVFAGILTLLNQQLGITLSTWLGKREPHCCTNSRRLRPTTSFHDITTGNNIIPCAQGTPKLPKDCSFPVWL